jgi:hypothetical protein
MKHAWSDSSVLVAIKVLHRLMWTLFVGCIVALPVTASLRRFRWSFALMTAVFLERVVVAKNHFRCPLTNLAARYSCDPNPNFDIYLPVWLARNNQRIFGILFAVARLFTAASTAIFRGQTVCE